MSFTLLKIPKYQVVPLILRAYGTMLVVASLTFEGPMEKLVFDVGNTRIKGALFNCDVLQDIFYLEGTDALISKIRESSLPVIVSSVAIEASIFEVLPVDQRPLFLTPHTPLPISIHYDTPHTLGVDRLAAATGAYAEFPGQNVLIIDLGTCNTYDVLDKNGTFQGGVISPGYQMRMRSMHEMTGRLPDISQDQQVNTAIPGKSTRECMSLGAQYGMSLEINGFIEHFGKEYDELCVIVTGGSTTHFESFIKPPIFVRPEIVLVGLNRILDDNVAN